LTVLTIAIPTLNRVNKLKVAADAIASLVVPYDMKLCLAISNSSSTDDTRHFLKSFSIHNAELFINNKRSPHHNWTALSMVVPKESDFVWLHGDDDIIFNKNALVDLERAGIFEQKQCSSITSIPQARRSLNSGLVGPSTLGALAVSYGAHEVAGWMSSLLMSSDVYFAFARDYEKAFHDRPTNTQMFDRRLGNYFHLTYLMERFWTVKASIVDLRLIDEQIDPAEKRDYQKKRRLFEFKKNYLFSDRFFFDAENLIKISEFHPEAQTEIFFRYVTKSLIDVLVLITLDEIDGGVMDSPIHTSQKIETISALHHAMRSHSRWDDLQMLIDLLKDEDFRLSKDGVLLRRASRPFSYPLGVVL